MTMMHRLHLPLTRMLFLNIRAFYSERFPFPFGGMMEAGSPHSSLSSPFLSSCTLRTTLARYVDRLSSPKKLHMHLIQVKQNVFDFWLLLLESMNIIKGLLDVRGASWKLWPSLLQSSLHSLGSLCSQLFSIILTKDGTNYNSCQMCFSDMANSYRKDSQKSSLNKNEDEQDRLNKRGSTMSLNLQADLEHALSYLNMF